MIPHVEIQLAYLRSLLCCARTIGARVLRVFTGFATGDTQHLRDWNACVRAAREAAAIAADHGVVLGIQNHHDVAVGLASYAEFLDEVGHPNCKAMFDPWSVALQGGQDLRAAARALAPRMVQTTLADYVRMRRFSYVPNLEDYREQPAWLRAVPLGTGDIMDLAAFAQGLKEGGFRGYVCYEMCSPLRGGGSLENLDRTARESLAAMRRLCS
jgi:sugar phosphate isomerase/epimerase